LFTTWLFVAAALFVGLASCSGNEVGTSLAEAQLKNYTVDSKASTLSWKGGKSAEDFHIGTVAITEGKVESKDGSLVKGRFVIDMKSIAVKDEMLPDDKKAMLKGHLSSPDFFDVDKHSKVQVSLGAIKGGKAAAIITVMGQEIKQTLPVSFKSTEKGAVLTGKFKVDFSSLNRPGFQPYEGESEFIQPLIDFDLKVQLK